jgi:hypothetical protein
MHLDRSHFAERTIFALVFMALRWFPTARRVIVSASCGIIGLGAVPRFARKVRSGTELSHKKRLKCLILLQSILKKWDKSIPLFGILSRALVHSRLPEEA